MRHAIALVALMLPTLAAAQPVERFLVVRTCLERVDTVENADGVTPVFQLVTCGAELVDTLDEALDAASAESPAAPKVRAPAGALLDDGTPVPPPNDDARVLGILRLTITEGRLTGAARVPLVYDEREEPVNETRTTRSWTAQ